MDPLLLALTDWIRFNPWKDCPYLWTILQIIVVILGWVFHINMEIRIDGNLVFISYIAAIGWYVILTDFGLYILSRMAKLK